jgi:hypothetical protein
MRARIAAGRPARPAGGQAPMSVVVPTFSERATGQSGGCRQWLGRAVDRLLAAGAERGDSPGTWIESYRAGGGNGRPRGQRPYAGAHRESPGRAGRPCAAVRPCTRESVTLASLDGLGTQAAVLVSTGHSVASTNRHRIPAGWNPMPRSCISSRGWGLGRAPICHLAPWPPRLWTSRMYGPVPSRQTASRAHAGWLIWRRAADRGAYHLHLPRGDPRRPRILLARRVR